MFAWIMNPSETVSLMKKEVGFRNKMGFYSRVNWNALDQEEPCEICGKLGRHTTLIGGEALCTQCAIKYAKCDKNFINTAEEYFKNSLWKFLEGGEES